jgi:hypothetical protein
MPALTPSPGPEGAEVPVRVPLAGVAHRIRMQPAVGGFDEDAEPREGDVVARLHRGQYRSWDTAPTPLQLALARGHRWLAMMESGEVGSMKEIARREGVDDSYVSRMVNLTTLAPDIVAAILDEALSPEVTLFELAAGTPLVWGGAVGKLAGNL